MVIIQGEAAVGPISIQDLLPALAYLCVTAAAGIGAAVLWRGWQRGKRWFPLPRLRFGCWTGLDVVFVFLIVILAPRIIAVVLQSTHFFDWYYGNQNVPDTRKLLWLGPILLPLFLVMAFAALRSLSGTYPADIGLSVGRWRSNLLLGYVGFVLATPPVLLVYMLLSLLPQVKEHPFEKLLSVGIDPAEWCLLFFAAAVMAPVQEEVLFRGLIQGWLRRASLGGHLALAAITIYMSLNDSIEISKAIREARDADGRPMLPTPEQLWNGIEAINWWRIGATLAVGAIYIVWLIRLQKKNLFLTEAEFQAEQGNAERSPTTEPAGTAGTEIVPPAATTAPAVDWKTQDQIQQRSKVWLAIFGAAFFFAFNHGTWPGPIPLLLLGLSLGWLTHRTQNLLPAIVVHSLFNLVATLSLLFLQWTGTK